MNRPVPPVPPGAPPGVEAAPGPVDPIGRLSSGRARLDLVLGGGIPAYGVTILSGLPGSGKTILAEQFAFANATPERPALYFSTVSEPLEKLLRFGQGLSFFDPLLIGSAVRYHDLSPVLMGQGLPGVLDHLVEAIKEQRPSVLVIDSFKALAAFAPDEMAYRQFLQELSGWLSVSATSTFWVGEYNEAELATAAEFAVADTIVHLDGTRSETRQLRSLRVLKLRGGSYAPGGHSFRITADGLDLYPRLADLGDPSSYEQEIERQSSGIEAVDQMLLDGYRTGSATLCAGPSGVGKTLMGLHFVFHAATRGEPAIIATLQENPTQLARIARGFGWALDDPNVEVMYRSPVDIHIDQWVYELLDTLDRTGAKRVLIDSLSDLQFAAVDDIRFREFMYSLTQRCARRNISLFMTSELPDLFHLDRLSQYGVSHMADNVILLQYQRGPDRIDRTLTVLKTRASRHQPEIRPFQITPSGIRLAPDQTATASFG